MPKYRHYMSEIIVISKEELQELIEQSVRNIFAEQSHRSEHSVQNEIFSIDEAASFLNLTKPTIYGFTSKNLIPFMKKGKRLYFKKNDLENWLMEGKHKSISELKIEFNNNRNRNAKIK